MGSCRHNATQCEDKSGFRSTARHSRRRTPLVLATTLQFNCYLMDWGPLRDSFGDGLAHTHTHTTSSTCFCLRLSKYSWRPTRGLELRRVLWFLSGPGERNVSGSIAPWPEKVRVFPHIAPVLLKALCCCSTTRPPPPRADAGCPAAGCTSASKSSPFVWSSGGPPHHSIGFHR